VNPPLPPLLLKDETYRIRGAAFHVYRAMGPGFLESIYEECLAIEFKKRGMPFERQHGLRVSYEGQELPQRFVADFVCFETVLIEIKAVRALAREHRAQIFNYLRCTGATVGLLLNFCSSPKMEIERFALQ
jgi:GxxExxY protein